MSTIPIAISNQDLTSPTSKNYTTSGRSSTTSIDQHPSIRKRLSRSIKRHLEPLRKLSYRDFVQAEPFLLLFGHRHGHGYDHTMTVAEEDSQDNEGSDGESGEFDIMFFVEGMTTFVEEDLPEVDASGLWELLEALCSLLVELLTLCDV